MENKFDIDYYFSDKEIIKILCKKRALSAKKIHDNHFLRNISQGAEDPHKFLNKEIFTFFPPRSQWIRLDQTERRKRNTNALETNAIQLERTIWRIKKKLASGKNKLPDWLERLNKFILEIRANVLDNESSYKLPKPKTIPVVKDKVKNEYRPISSFDLKSLIIVGQVSKYLTNCFDQLFLDCSYAFRSGIKKGKSFNHHEAVRNIIEYNTKRENDIYVAECDIKKFYDCVNHSVIFNRFHDFVKRAKDKLDIEIDPRAIKIFESYLDCFSFNNDIAKKQVELLAHRGIKKGTIPWVSSEELSEVNSNPDTDMIGVPQGGAISCLIANIILDSVDQKVLAVADENTFYARFCDDMVLMHPDKTICQSIFNTYQIALKEAKLISHKPIEIGNYSREFWGPKLKSKAPYNWSQFKNTPEMNNNVPWLSFVGYQIRYDNLLRIRKSSIEKELKKQVNEVDNIIKVISRAKKTTINKKAVVFRLQQRLISMAVGRAKSKGTPLTMCWSAGFTVIREHKNIPSQFIKLDRNREKQIKRMIRYIDSISTPNRKSKRKVKQLKYYGSQYSYHQQFI